MTASLYMGFSSVANLGIDTRLTGVNLIVQDLLNQFNTDLDERVMLPRWGSIIPSLLFDLSEPRTQSLILADAQRILSADPRIRVVRITPTINVDEYQIMLVCKCNAIEYNMDFNFTVLLQAG